MRRFAVVAACVAASALVGVAIERCMRRRRIIPVVGELWVYPVKSCRGVQCTSARFTAYGLEHDRQWFVRKASDGSLLTLRNAPRLALVQPTIDVAAGVLRLNAAADAGDEGVPRDDAGVAVPLEVKATAATGSVEFEVWGIKGQCVDEGAEAAAWLTRVIGIEARLCRTVAPREPKDDVNMRCVIPVDGGLVLAHDASPLMLMSAATAEEVADACGDATVTVRRFRPNIVFYGIPARAEDRFRRFRIGDAEIAVSRLCTRCSVPTVRPDGTCHPRFEPSKTLRKRWSAVTRPNSKSAKPVCGISAFQVNTPSGVSIEVGMAVQVLEALASAPTYVSDDAA